MKVGDLRLHIYSDDDQIGTIGNPTRTWEDEDWNEVL